MLRDNEMIFNSFLVNAQKKIEEKKKRRTFKIHMKEMDAEINFRGISIEEFDEAKGISEVGREQDEYIAYMASEDLQEDAAELVRHSVLKNHREIMKLFDPSSVTRIVLEILKISGITGSDEIEIISEVNDLKN